MPSASAANGSDSTHRTPSLSLSPYLESTAASTPVVSTPSAGLGIPMSGTMERSNSGSSFVTARSESWFGFGGSNQGRGEAAMSEEPQEIGSKASKVQEDELAQEVIQTPVRATFSQADENLSPRPPKKEATPPRAASINISPRKQPTLDAPIPPPRPSSPSPSQITIASTISSSNKDLPAKVASPPLPPLPPSTPLSSALSSPTFDNSGVETDPTKLPFSSTSRVESPPSTTARARPARTGQVPRPLAIHIAASSSLSSTPMNALSPSANSFLTCPSPASSATTPVSPSLVVGGPSQSEMTAGARSPESPNELRWKEAASTIIQPPARQNVRASSSSSSRSRSGSRQSNVGKENISSPIDRSFKKDVLPPSPPSAGGGSEVGSTAKKPLPPTTKEKNVPSIPPKTAINERVGGGLRIDTSLPEPVSVTPRPTERGPRSARPTSASANGISKPSLFRHHSTQNSSTAPKNSLTPSFGSNSSISSQLSDVSSGGHSTSSGLLSGFKNGSISRSGRGGKNAVPLSPDGTKAVEDLEKLMESMMDMFE